MEDEALIDYKSEGVERSIECENGCSDESFADLIKEKGGESSSNSEINTRQHSVDHEIKNQWREVHAGWG